MNLADLNTWLDYHYWARDVILDAVAPLSAEQFTRPIESSFKSVRDTLAHTYGAEWLWYQPMDRSSGRVDAEVRHLAGPHVTQASVARSRGQSPQRS